MNTWNIILAGMHVQCVMTKNRQASNKTTNIVACGLVFSCLIGFFLWYDNIPETFYSVYSFVGLATIEVIITIINEALFQVSLQLTVWWQTTFEISQYNIYYTPVSSNTYIIIIIKGRPKKIQCKNDKKWERSQKKFWYG